MKTTVKIIDKALLPENLCEVTVTMRLDLWRKLCATGIASIADTGEAVQVTFAPSLALIEEALGKPCPVCGGKGRRIEDKGPEELLMWCLTCNGSGHASVPGARLVEK